MNPLIPEFCGGPVTVLLRHAVVEIFGGQMSVTIHPTARKAENRAVALAKSNTSATKEEAREHLRSLGHHKEGDYEVHLIDAVEHL